jgi:hypothetical protein
MRGVEAQNGDVETVCGQVVLLNFIKVMRIRNPRKVVSSVADPDPPDPHVFGPPGSGSESIIKQK